MGNYVLGTNREKQQVRGQKFSEKLNLQLYAYIHSSYMNPIILNEDVVLLYLSVMKTIKVLRDWIHSKKIIESLKIISELLSS